MAKRNYLPTFIVAYLLCIGGLNQLMGIILNRKDGIMIMNLIPVAGLLALHFFISDKKNDLNLDKKALLFVYYIVSIIVVYKYAFRYTTISYTELIVYCFIPIYVSFYKVNVEKLLKFMILFSVLVLPVSNEFFVDVGRSGYETIGMSTTYNALPFVLAAVLHFWYYRKNAGFYMWIGYAVNIYYLFNVVFLGNRGPIISLVVLGILLILHKFKLDGTIKKSTTRTTIITIMVGIVVVYVINDFEEILFSAYKWLRSVDIEISALSKTINKLGQGDLSNGRNFVFDFTINGIRENYLIGNGIGTIFYNSFYRISYPHNLFLQMWYDLGIIVSLPMLWLIGKATRTTFFKNSVTKDYLVILILLFVLSIPRLCYSSEFWTNIPFWLLIMFTISPNLYRGEIDNSNDEQEK